MSDPNEAALEQGVYRVWIVTASDKGARGEREDTSGRLARDIAEAAGFVSSGYTLLSDDQEGIEKELKRICDNGLAELVLTTGGTGFSERDRMPEATLAAAERIVPGIPEAMRQHSLGITKRAMLSRGAAVIRGKTLIVNLPGSPRAVRENLDFIVTELRHGLDLLSGRGGECARP
jgi:molybdenum cofactor synthesis domain-containing protein